MNSGYFTIRKGGGVEARRLMRVFVEPETDRVLWLHVRVLLVLIRAKAAVFASVGVSDPPVHPFLIISLAGIDSESEGMIPDAFFRRPPTRDKARD